ncbi:MAG TPA: hypothetical protein VGN37_00360 [Actinocatenispora sp.]
MPRVVPGVPARRRRTRIAVVVLLGVALMVSTAAIWFGVTGSVDPASHEPALYPPPSPAPTLSGMPFAP